MGGQYRWLVCALLFLATTINYVDRQILALLKPTLDAELGWTNQQFAHVTSLFHASYAVSVLAFGALVDRIGTRRGHALSIAGWSLAALGHALVGSVAGLAVARVALGLGEGGNFPSAIKAVALWFPRRERALATSLFNAGTNAGAMLAPPLTAWLVAGWGWRAAFVAAGLAGFLWLAAWWGLYDIPERVPALRPRELHHIRGDAADDAGLPVLVTLVDLLRHRQTWSFIVAKLLTDPVWWFFLYWLPDFFGKTRGLAIGTSWVHLATIYGIVTVLSVAGGWLTGRLARGRTITRARKTGLFIFAVCVLPVLGAGRTGPWGTVLLCGLAMGAHQAWSATLYTTVSDMFPRRTVARVIGLGAMAGSLGGIGFQLYAGALLDRFTAGGTAGHGYAVLFTLCSSAYLVAFAAHHGLAPSLRPISV
jgi:ACS family hexuronate transporter-like MFS transporter